MTNWGYDGSQNNDQGDNPDLTPGGLRSFAEAQKAENKALKDQLQAIQDQLKTQSLQSVFTELGVPGAVTQYQGDADPEKIKTWVEDQRKIFGAPAGAPVETPAVDVPQGLPESMQKQMDAFTQAGQSGTPLGTVEQAFANVNDANDLQSLVAAMKFSQ